jgi:catechol 2,3-dioxygenase-like lactoylglutathione lyase family enzyme
MTNSTEHSVETSPSGIKGIHHIGISVSNLTESLAFFEGATTLVCHSREGFSGTGLAVAAPEEVAILKGPNGYIELMQFSSTTHGDAQAIPVEGPGITHMCVQSPADLGMYNLFKNQQAKAVTRGTGPVDLGGYGVHYAYLRNADQTMFEVEEIDKPQFDGPVWVAHIALVSHDIDRLVDFYSRMLGIAPYRRADKVAGPRIEEVTNLDKAKIRAAWFNIGNMVLELWEYVSPATPDTGAARPFEKLGYNKYTFEVTNLESEVIRLTALGINFTGPVLKTPAGREAYATDPDGNCFSVLQLDKDSLSIDHLSNISWETA